MAEETAWSGDEQYLIVANYFAILGKEVAG